MKNRLTPLVAGLALFVILLAPSAIGSGSAVAPGSITSASFHSAVLNEDIAYNVYLPAGYEGSAERYPVLYLLHGRGDSATSSSPRSTRSARTDRPKRRRPGSKPWAPHALDSARARMALSRDAVNVLSNPFQHRDSRDPANA